VILEVVDPNATGPVELPDAEKLKIAKAYGNKASNAADSEPMIGEAKDAMMSTLKGSIDDLGKVNADIESLQMNLDAELANLDPELAAALKSGLDADLKAQTQNQASAEDMHKAAQAAAVCITKGM
jgi:conjugal transfer/entry exclusion protein